MDGQTLQSQELFSAILRINSHQNTNVKTVVFCDVTPHSLVDITNVSNEGADFIITSILKKGAVCSSEMLAPV